MDPFIGEIRMFAGTFAPMDWAFCDGGTLQISMNAALYSLIGTIYGGNGSTTFALPDLCGRLPMHAGQLNGTGAAYTLGQSDGAEQVALTTNQLPMHTHVAQASASAGDRSSPQNAVWAKTDLPSYSSSAPSQAMGSSSIGSAGSGQAHDNIMPFLAVNFIICLAGIYPSRP
jgi:microcystin-dependent protein